MPLIEEIKEEPQVPPVSAELVNNERKVLVELVDNKESQTNNKGECCPFHTLV